MASPMPETKYRAGASATIAVSMITKAGLHGKNSAPSETPSGVYKTERAEHGASLEASEGQIIDGILRR